MESLLKQKLPKLLDLTEKVVIITGGAYGIGQGISLRFAQAGARVIIADINFNGADEVAKKISDEGGKARPIKADVSSVKDIKRAVEEIIKEYGSIDILINNAGIYPMMPMLDMTEELWDKVITLNLKGTFFFSQTVAKQMVKRGKGGKIINLASIDAFHPTGNLVHYDASKGGVRMMTKSMALELAPYKIMVNGIAPGGISTPSSDAVSESAKKQMLAAGMKEEDIMKAFVARTPIGRMGEPDDIAKVALFLASDLSGYMTGTTIVVDGGYLLS